MAKIIFVNRYFFPDQSATSRLLSDLAFDLAALGHDVHVISGVQLYTDRRAALPTWEVVRGVQVRRVCTSRFGRSRLCGRMLDYLTFYVAATWRLLRLIRPDDVVVAKTDPPMFSVCAASATALKRGSLVNWIQDLFPEVALAVHVPGVRRAAPFLKHLRNWSWRRARTNVVLGSIMAARLQDEGIPSERITIIANWADGEAIRPVSNEDNPLRREWRLEDKFVVGYSGNMGRAHEFKTMIDAAELMKAAEELAFVFIGDGTARLWLEAEVKRRGLANIQFRPYQPAEHLRWSLSVPDVHFVSLQPQLEGLIVPSKFYGIAAAGRPVIFVGNPDGEIPRILERERCGWSFRVGEVEPLARWVLTLAHSRRDAVEAGRRARLAFDRRYTRAQALEEWRLLLGAVAAPVRRRDMSPAAVGEE